MAPVPLEILEESVQPGVYHSTLCCLGYSAFVWIFLSIPCLCASQQESTQPYPRVAILNIG
jgi:hypothetical protein